MRLTKAKRRLMQGAVLAGAACAWLFAACTAVGPPRPTCADVRDAGVTDATLDITPYTQLTTDAQPTSAYGMEPDPGPQCLDCTQNRDFEIMTISDFEDGFAPAWFNYGEPGVLIEPPQAGEGIGEDGMPTGVNPPQPWWGLQVAALETLPGGDRCGSKYALHMEGGRFVAWGGGYVTRHFITRGEHMTRVSPNGQHLCEVPRPTEPDPLKNGVGTAPAFMPEGTARLEDARGCMFWASPVTSQPSLRGVDVSDFDGVSFWARRGPSGQSLLRIALVDDNTSEDLALQVERDAWFGDPGAHPDEAGAKCERVKSCCRICNAVTHDVYVPAVTTGPIEEQTPASVRRDVTDKRCWLAGERLPRLAPKLTSAGDEAIAAWDFRDVNCGPEPTTDDTASTDCWNIDEASTIYDAWETDYALCCPYTMDEEVAIDDVNEQSGDPRYGGSECSPYIFQFDYSSGSYCHKPGDVLPERNQNRCGEGFEAAVVVDTEWKLFTIPWAELRRYTPDKPPFDPRGVWQVAFYFGQGMLDTYIDDVGFYRKRR
jgi:hypothetical protein